MRNFALIAAVVAVAAALAVMLNHALLAVMLSILSAILVILLYGVARVVHAPPPRDSESDLLKETLTHLQEKVDLLSAEREVSLVLNQDVDFKVILLKVLEIADDLIGGRDDDEMIIFLKDESDGHLVSRAARRKGETLFEGIEDIADDPSISAALTGGRRIMTADNDYLDVTLPLTADREIIGVMKIRTALEGDNDERDKRIERLTRMFDEFSKFISLAAKTPDLYTRAVEDGLTKLSTKRHFLSQLTMAVDGARRYGDPLSLVMIDIDHFKRINDTHGHQTGDEVLKGVADVLLKSLRKSGDAAHSGYRYGGEELSIILPKTPADKALLVAERLRRQVESRTFRNAAGEGVKVTISAGIAQYDPAMNGDQDLIAAADRALYRAKESGRNRVVAADGESMA